MTPIGLAVPVLLVKATLLVLIIVLVLAAGAFLIRATGDFLGRAR